MSASGKNVGPIRVDAESQADLANNSAGSIGGVTFNLSAPLLRPVTMHDSTAGGPMWLVQASQESGSSVTLIRVDNILTAGSVTTTPFTVPVASYSAPNPALNPDGTPIVSPFGGGQTDARILKAAEANNIIVASQTIGINSNEDGARWYEFNVSDINHPTLADEGTEHFGASTYATYSGIDINPVGDIGMSLILSGNDSSTDYMSVVVTGRNSSDPAGRMEDPAILVRAGDSNNTDGRMGDFSGINVDPDGSFWIANEFTTGGSGATEVVHFALSNNGEAFVKNGALEATGTNSDDSIILQPNPNNSGQTEVLDNGVDLGDFNNGTFSSINVDTFGGNDSLDITDNGGGIGLDFFGVPVTYDGGTGTNSVTLFDNDASFSDSYTITSNSFSRPFFGGLTYSNIQNLFLNAETGNNTININSTSAAVAINDDAGSDTINLSDGVQANGLDNLAGAVTVNGGGSDLVNLNDQSATFSDTYTITSTSASRPFFGGLTYSNIAGLTLNAETGNNTININSTAATTPVTINDDSGSDSVNLSDGVQANGLDNLAGAVTVNGGGSDLVNLNDQSATFSDTYTITSSSVSRPFFGGLTYGSVAGLTLNAETGNNTIDINSTPAGTAVTINDDAGSDTVNVGNGNLGNLPGAVTVSGAGGTTAVKINDQNNRFGQSYTVTATTVDLPGFGGLSYSSLASLTLNGGSGADLYNITGTSTPTTVNGRAANDTFNVGSGLASKLTLHGGGGSNTLVGPNVNNTWKITSNNGGRLDGKVTFSSIQTLTGGTANDNFVFSDGQGVTGTINGGAGTDTLDYSLYTTGVSVNLATGTATGTAGITAIENVTGGSAGDELIGNSGANVLLGNAGDDTLVGGGGNDILVGGAGNDNLIAGNGRSILIGGAGQDNLTGGNSDDILIGGTTAYDANTVALLAIMKEWKRATVSYADRIAHIRGTMGGGLNGPYFFNSSTVSDDGVADTLTGGAGLDWFWAGPQDTTDRNPATEQLN
jgi:Ca2+-binding RTX toxin-like protein